MKIKKILQLVFLLFYTVSYSQQKEYEVMNTSINSKYAELGVTYLSNNSIIFASSKKNENIKRRTNRQLYLELYQGLITENGDIVLTNKFTKELNNKFFEADISFTPDFKTVYFTWNNYYSSQKRQDSAKWKTLYMFKASINENFELSNIAPLPFNNKNYSVRSPEVSKGGKQLFFVSNMPGGFGETDIYVVDIFKNGTYSLPRNLGPTINTKEAESFPFVDENNTLYFSSYGHKGKGNLDIFKSEFINGNYQNAENLPEPINSKFDDFSFVVNNATNSGFFTSNRENGKGDVDIYAFKMKDKECVQSIAGLLLNENNGQLLEDVKVALFQNNELIENQIVGKHFKFNLKCNESYKIVAQKENFQDTEIEIITDNNYDFIIDKSINLTPLECNQSITGFVFNQINNQPIDGVLVSLYSNNKLVETQTINENSNYNFKLQCDESYKIIVQKEYFKDAQFEIKADNIYNFKLDKNINLTPLECNQSIAGLLLNKNNGQLINNVKVSLFENNVLKETQTIVRDSNYKFKLKCNESYKIVAQKEYFEDAEIEIKTDSNYNLAIDKTLSLVPLDCIQLITGTIVDNETKNALPNTIVKIFKENNLIDTLKIDTNANFSYKIDCNSQYRIVASSVNYQDAVSIFQTSNEFNQTSNRILSLDPNLEFVTVQQQKMVKTNTIYFDLDNDAIRPDAAIELDKVVSILYKYTSLKIEIKSYTDSRAPDDYNLVLSNKRATSAVNYIISKGIDPSRVSGQGYGETQLVNKCSNDVKCSEAEHQMNRRTEFIVIDE